LFPNFDIFSNQIDEGIFNESLRSFFRQQALRIAFTLPLFNEINYQYPKIEPLKTLIINKLLDFMLINKQQVRKFETQLSSARDVQVQPQSPSIEVKGMETIDRNDIALISLLKIGLNSEQRRSNFQKINDFIRKQKNQFKISNDGKCQYCNTLNINLSSREFDLTISDITDKQSTTTITDKGQLSLNSLLKNRLKAINEYAKIITNIKLTDTANKSVKSVSLTRDLIEHLPNVYEIFIKNVKIVEIDDSLNIFSKNLRIIEFHQNDLSELPATLFNEQSMLQHIVIDNNLINFIPKTIFLMGSLRALTLSRLNLTSLPDQWYQDVNVNEKNDDICDIRSLTISQTRIKQLPNDLFIYNKYLEQLTFQGVHLILPENEKQWSHMSIDLNHVTRQYCPNLLTIEEAKSIFTKYDYDNNGFLDYKELQHFNAFIFIHFPRLGDDLYKNSEFIQEAGLGGLFSSLFQFKSLTCLDLSFQAIRLIPPEIKSFKSLKILKLK
jgi:hypothetical protein